MDMGMHHSVSYVSSQANGKHEYCLPSVAMPSSSPLATAVDAHQTATHQCNKQLTNNTITRVSSWHRTAHTSLVCCCLQSAADHLITPLTQHQRSNRYKPIIGS
eukprot:GHRR01034628.1.p1 GENE.GHRR01034628.1~~GHRR01034628.1.p1  ORF type:complete len:104 (+),score=13.90 GHRR01034628.1:397-708(+)